MTTVLLHDRNADKITWVLAILMALCLQGVWLVWLRPARAIKKAHTDIPPHMVYRPILATSPSSGKDHEGVHAVWSPVLFSLPTSVGFSQPMFSDGANSMRPPLQAPTASSMFLARPSKPWPQTWAVGPSGSKKIIQHTLSQYIPVSDYTGAEPSHEKVLTKSGLHMQFLDGLTDVVFTAHNLPASCLHTQVWSLSVYLELAPRGYVAHVLLEDASGITEKEEVVRAIYQWRAEPAAMPRTGRVVMRYDGVQEETGQTEVVP